MTLLAIIFAITWLLTMAGGMAMLKRADNRIAELKANPVTITKEIEVVKRAVCECHHESSKHADDDGPCQEILFKTVDGVETNKSFRCKCVRYTGPKPMPLYYAPDIMKELE